MFKPIRLLPSKTNIDFLGKRRLALVLSTIINIVAIALPFVVGLNFGIDFRGGTLLGLIGPLVVGTAMNLVALNDADHLLHLGTSALLLVAAWVLGRRLPPAT